MDLTERRRRGRRTSPTARREVVNAPRGGPGRGGPHAGIVHTDVTRELLALGKKVTPFLVARLPDSNFDEAVYITFLPRELGAVEARPAVLQLQSQIDQRSVGRDLTLQMQVEYFLRDTDELIAE